MSKKIQKSLQDYLSKIKNPHSQIQLPSKKWILSGCKHPRTPSFAIDDGKRNEAHGSRGNNNNNDDEATLADIDRFLFENFKSLYLKGDEETDNNNNNTKRVSVESHDKAPKLGPIMFEEPPLDLCGSNRFFMTHRSFSGSGSLVEDFLTTTGDEVGSSSTSNTTLNDSSSNFHYHRYAKEGMDKALPDNCVAVLACSPCPHEDFRRSMQDMVEARLRNHERVDWDFMEELLFCYINLNEKKSFKFILSAFVDLITVMRRHSETAPAKPKPRSVRTVRIGKEVVRKKKTKEVTLEFGSS